MTSILTIWVLCCPDLFFKTHTNEPMVTWTLNTRFALSVLCTASNMFRPSFLIHYWMWSCSANALKFLLIYTGASSQDAVVLRMELPMFSAKPSIWQYGVAMKTYISSPYNWTTSTYQYVCVPWHIHTICTHGCEYMIISLFISICS